MIYLIKFVLSQLLFFICMVIALIIWDNEWLQEIVPIVEKIYKK